jgi:Fe-S oxidoreductase
MPMGNSIFCDEFTNYYVSVGIDAFELLSKLGYEVIVVDHEESGRAYIQRFSGRSKGLLIKT